MSALTSVQNSDFAAKVLQSDLPVLVDFWAPWCGPCKMMAPVLDQLSSSLAGRLTVVKVNVDENQPVAAEYGIMSIPTLMLFKDGKPVAKAVGFVQKEALQAALENYLAA